MNFVHDLAAAGLLDGSLDLIADDLAVGLWDYVYLAPWHGYLSDILYESPLAAPEPLAGKTVVGRTLRADDTVFPALAENREVRNVIIHRVSDGLLVAHIDTRPDRMGIHLTGNGGPVTVAWANGEVLTL